MSRPPADAGASPCTARNAVDTFTSTCPGTYEALAEIDWGVATLCGRICPAGPVMVPDTEAKRMKTVTALLAAPLCISTVPAYEPGCRPARSTESVTVPECEPELGLSFNHD